MIPQTLKQIRKDNHLRQKDAARMVFVSRQLWSHWELGTHKPRPEHITRIKEVFKIQISAA